MIIYSFIFLYLFLFSFLLSKNNNKNVIIQNSFDFLVFPFAIIILSIFASIRYDVGKDYLQYIKILDKSLYLTNRGDKGFFELGFILVYYIIDALNLHTIFIFAFFSFSTYFFINKSLLRFRYLYPFSVFLFFTDGYLFASFNGMRQYLAIALFMYSIIFISKRNFIMYLLCIFFGYLFHKSIVLLIPLYFILDKRIPNKIIFIVLLISVILGFNITNIPIDLLFSISPTYVGYFNLFIQTFKPDLSIVMIYKILLLLLIIFNRKISIDKNIRPFYNLYFIYLSITILFSNSWVISRFTEYFKISSLIVIPWIVTKMRKKTRYLVFIITIVFFLFFFFNTLNVSGDSEKLIYKTIFSNE